MRFLGLVVAVLVSVLAGAPAALAQGTADFGRYFALVIGNDAYRHLPRLKTAGNDARAIADLLRARYGFQVELLLDIDRDQLVQAVNSYRATLKDGDNLLIYYAGHGQIDEPTERGFWLTVDAHPGNEARWLDVALVSSNLRAMQARHIIVIADSCYSGSLVRDSGGTGLATGGDELAVLQRIRERRARMALTSGSLEPVVDGGDSGHSVFAGALLKVLRDNVGYLTGAELFSRLRARVVAGARQTPLYADIRFAGHEGGDFIFVPRGAETAGPPQAPAETEAAIELAFWNSIKDSLVADDYQAYLDAFPAGRFAPLARRRAELKVAVAPTKSSPPSRPAKARPSLAIAPVAPAQPAIADEADLAERWREVSIILRRQYDAAWALSDFAHYLLNFGRYRVDALTADEVALTLDYMTHEISPNGGPGFPRPRHNTVRFRNRAPGFAILQWGKAVAESSLAGRAQFDIHWEQIRDRLMAQYDRDFAIADGAFDMAELGAYRVERINGEEIALRIDYTIHPITGADRSAPRSALLRLRNRAPGFDVLQWGDLIAGGAEGARLRFADAGEARQFWPILRRALERQYAESIRFRSAESIAGAETGPPAEMHIRRQEITTIDGERLTISLAYEVSSGAAQRDRDAVVTLRNLGPGFEVIEWRR